MPKTAQVDVKKAQLKIDRARWFWLSCSDERVFHGQLTAGLIDRFKPGIGTACTDAKHIFWEPGFVEAMSPEECRAVLVHEALHPAHGHLWRHKIDKWWNIAIDWVVNTIISKMKGYGTDIKLPERVPGYIEHGIYFPPPAECFLPNGDLRPEEELYWIAKKLYPDEPGKGRGPGPGGGQDGDGVGDIQEPADDKGDKGGDGKGKKKGNDQGEGGGAGDDDTLEQDWERRVINAAQIASMQGRGNVPADMQGILDRIAYQPLDWRRELTEFAKNVISTKNDWSRASKRHSWQSVVYPRKKVNEIGTIVLAPDNSGSVGDKAAAAFLGHGEDVMAETGCRLIILWWDTEIHKELRVEPGESIPYIRPCGGGTDATCVFERVHKLAEDGEQIAGLVILSDCDANWPAEDGEFPLLTLSTTDRVCPHGRTIRIDEP